jgi:hypothetical protein
MKLIYVILLMLLAGCTSLKTHTIDNTTDDVSITSTPKIIFINYKVSKKIDETIKVDLINKIIAEGSLKMNDQKENNNDNNFTCTQIDKNLLPIDSLYISNPLIKNIEFITPSGLLDKKRIELDSTEFSVRMQLNPRTKFITLKMKNLTLSKIIL